MVPGAGGYELKRDDGTSAAEQLARLVPKGRVVTAFTSISSALIRDPASGEKPTVFTGADDEGARATVIALATEIGFEGVDAGHLDASRNIENLGLLVGQLAYDELTPSPRGSFYSAAHQSLSGAACTQNFSVSVPAAM
jgi:predicted dinucleotide-binding enzyme